MKIPDLAELGKNYTLMLLNTFHSLHGMRTLLPGLVEVGGMHLNDSRKLMPRVSKLFIHEKETGTNKCYLV